ncbi:hypothetical protein KUC_3538 [Vreelandella boliviensis LC1]|uniref:Uncharacterized protein n=1 Tax=Vreelandella boliviensis LC1 TaxID=1072583 RepID=A0A7U9GF76_9GAMM|nr:hypothetical protein KUC_3538 [Halomonas boliviensis LC1]
MFFILPTLWRQWWLSSTVAFTGDAQLYRAVSGGMIGWASGLCALRSYGT